MLSLWKHSSFLLMSPLISLIFCERELCVRVCACKGDVVFLLSLYLCESISLIVEEKKKRKHLTGPELDNVRVIKYFNAVKYFFPF